MALFTIIFWQEIIVLDTYILHFDRVNHGWIYHILYVKEKTVVKGFLNDIIESTSDGNLRLGTMISFDIKKIATEKKGTLFKFMKLLKYGFCKKLLRYKC